MDSGRGLMASALLVGAFLGSFGSLRAQTDPTRLNVWDIPLDATAPEIPDAFVNYACGTNGGPPSIPLAGFKEFRKCKPDASGLREVYFEYDDELEYRARALDLTAQIRMYAGTTAYEFPVVASVLFDEFGVVRGKRLVTDPRQRTSRDRFEFWMLADFIRQRFDADGWNCRDLRPEDGESAIGSRFIKTDCEKVTDAFRVFLKQRYFQKKGQRSIDPFTGKPRGDEFESATSFEIYSEEPRSGSSRR